MLQSRELNHGVVSRATKPRQAPVLQQGHEPPSAWLLLPLRTCCRRYIAALGPDMSFSEMSNLMSLLLVARRMGIRAVSMTSACALRGDSIVPFRARWRGLS